MLKGIECINSVCMRFAYFSGAGACLISVRCQMICGKNNDCRICSICVNLVDCIFGASNFVEFYAATATVAPVFIFIFIFISFEFNGQNVGQLHHSFKFICVTFYYTHETNSCMLWLILHRKLWEITYTHIHTQRGGERGRE